MKKKGYMFLSLLITISVIGILSTSFAGVLLTIDKRHREEELRFNMINITKALKKYNGQEGEYPRQLDDLLKEGYLRRGYSDPYVASGKKWYKGWNYNKTLGEISSKSKLKSLGGNPYENWRVVDDGGSYIINETGEEL